MNLGSLTKQLAQQAIGSQVKDVMESISPSEPAGHPEEHLGQTLLNQIVAMEKALKEDRELAVICTAGPETLRVLEIFLPTWSVAVLTGVDADRSVTRVISPVNALQLVCKPMPVTPGTKPVRLRVVAPKS
ncbi:MAG TPA: hypothetical protein VES20_01610 [Bryobacteraceae bacterium]|nr:hypothetical protein [Bryobacteraceae bacterium]